MQDLTPYAAQHAPGCGVTAGSERYPAASLTRSSVRLSPLLILACLAALAALPATAGAQGGTPGPPTGQPAPEQPPPPPPPPALKVEKPGGKPLIREGQIDRQLLGGTWYFRLDDARVGAAERW